MLVLTFGDYELPSVNSFLGVSAFLGALYAFWTGTIQVIIALAYTNYMALIYMIGLALIIGVPLYQMTTGRHIIDVSRRNLFLGLILALVIFPVLVQDQYDVDELALYNGEPTTIALGADPLIGDHETKSTHYNSSDGASISSGSITETHVANGTWSVTLSLAVQDLDKKSTINIAYDAQSSASDTWNATAFDVDTTDHIVAIGLRIETAVATTLYYKCGLQDKTDSFTGTIATSDSRVSMIYLDTAFYNWLDEYAVQAANDAFYFYIWENDAYQFVDAAVIEFEVHFYTETSMAQFESYMMYTGLGMILIAAAETRYFNPTGRRRRRGQGYRRYHRARANFRRRRRRYRR